MTDYESIDVLRAHGIKPSAQRIAVASWVLQTQSHPSADEVYRRVASTVPMISRATVYNTLNLLVDKGLLRKVVLTEGHIRFDPNLERHHHFIDDQGGKIYDVPWSAVRVGGLEALEGFEVRDHQVVMRGRRTG